MEKARPETRVSQADHLGRVHQLHKDLIRQNWEGMREVKSGCQIGTDSSVADAKVGLCEFDDLNADATLDDVALGEAMAAGSLQMLVYFLGRLQ